jgi:hypothetical protein
MSKNLAGRSLVAFGTIFTFCWKQPGSDRLQPCRHCLEKLFSFKNWEKISEKGKYLENEDA